MVHHSYFTKLLDHHSFFWYNNENKNFREKTRQVKKQTFTGRFTSKRYTAFERVNMLCPGDEFVQIALGQEIRNPLEWLLYEFRTLFDRLLHFFEYSKILRVKKKDFLILLIDFIIFYSTFDLKALYCSNDRNFRHLLCRWL